MITLGLAGVNESERRKSHPLMGSWPRNERREYLGQVSPIASPEVPLPLNERRAVRRTPTINFGWRDDDPDPHRRLFHCLDDDAMWVTMYDDEYSTLEDHVWQIHGKHNVVNRPIKIGGQR